MCCQLCAGYVWRCRVILIILILMEARMCTARSRHVSSHLPGKPLLRAGPRRCRLTEKVDDILQGDEVDHLFDVYCQLVVSRTQGAVH